jgi:hypothetical protein
VPPFDRATTGIDVTTEADVSPAGREREESMATTNKTGEIAARLDRLPPSWYVWRMIILISLGGLFEFYDRYCPGRRLDGRP